MRAGVDEAGRGPVLGPLVVAGVHADPDALPAEVADSKTLTPTTREAIAHEIHEHPRIETSLRTIEAPELNERMQQGQSLDLIELDAMATTIRQLSPQRVLVDAVGNDPDTFSDTLDSRLPETCQVTARSKADASDPLVAAASIVAKTHRDACIQKIEASVGEPIGSGYPSDPATRAFLKAYRERSAQPPGFARTAWKTLDAFGFGTARLDQYQDAGGAP